MLKERKVPLGVRKNNPGNIRYNSKNEWVGKTVLKDRPDFESFVAPEYGIRAMVLLLRKYHDEYKLKTISNIINRWAPPEENDTKSYIRSVSSMVGIPKDKKIQLERDTLLKLVIAIIQVEQGYQPYKIEIIKRGLEYAGKS